MNDRKAIVLLVGQSGSGKTSIAHYCSLNFNYDSVQSYTTRPKRKDDEEGHTFVTNAEFDKLHDFVAYTEYNGYRYGATSEQIDSNDIYVLDVNGIKTFREKYKGDKKPYVIYIKADEKIRRGRMKARGDSEEAIAQRIKFDRTAFADVEEYADFVCDNRHEHNISDIANFIDLLLSYSERSDKKE